MKKLLLAGVLLSNSVFSEDYQKDIFPQQLEYFAKNTQEENQVENLLDVKEKIEQEKSLTKEDLLKRLNLPIIEEIIKTKKGLEKFLGDCKISRGNDDVTLSWKREF
jgi:hypothetical protein